MTEEQKKKPAKKPFASVNTHFTLMGTVDVATGDVPVAEQVQCVDRFIRYHERQAAIGRELLKKISTTPVEAVTQ